MKNQIKKFKAKIAEIISYKEKAMNESKVNAIAKIPTLKLITFTNETPYDGELNNTIFFTYSNHYRGNLGTWMSVNSLNHPHLNYEDRGYIKGVATDLTGYLTLRTMSVEPNINDSFTLYKPKFRKSKHSESYEAQCQSMIAEAKNKLNEYAQLMNVEINAELRKLTDCSLLHYLRAI